ncbi:ATP-binding protein [Acetobacter vaccinii]|uniref:ATP-binding protein n=1 Tax=Acetobacter vaccinii TaxID=2592655 RepID=A0A5C1YUG7_9PROT|nr:ATP-binding protein [Acetobacter vaccinii]QEO18867.1 ATP-binding protein [Acetobacter vaccinii]
MTFWRRKPAPAPPSQSSPETAAPPPRKTLFDTGLRPMTMIMQGMATASRMFRIPVTSFCDLATCDQHGLLTLNGEYATVLRLRGRRVLGDLAEITAAAARLRLDMASLFNDPGHALQFCYTADPDGATQAVARNLDDRRTIARALGAEFEDIFRERLKILPGYMRQERACLVLWTRPGRLSRPELKQANRQRKAAYATLPPLGDAQNPLLGSQELGTVHSAFVSQIVSALTVEGIVADVLPPKDGLRLIREEIYPETVGSEWSACTPADRPPMIIPETDRPEDASDMLWPPLREQLFIDDVPTPDIFTARLGLYDWRPLELTRVSEEIRPFTELVGRMAARRQPWRMTGLIEGVRPSYMMWKAAVATLLKFGSNTSIYNGFESLKANREAQKDNTVKLRVSFATCAPAGDTEKLGVRTSRLQQTIGAWGGASANRMCGDPLAGTLSSVPGLAIASTAPPTAAPLSKALIMMPWTRPATPWQDGAVLFRAADGTIVPFDPAGSGRDARLDLFIGPSRRGKSALDNVLLLGTLLSPASMTDQGVKPALIAKLDIGDSTSGLIDMIHSAMGSRDKGEAIHIPFDLIPEHAYNIFDTEACCRYPLSYHNTVLRSFIGLVCTPLDGKPFESLDQLIDRVIRAAYEIFSDEGTSIRPKIYRPDENRPLDHRLAHHGLDIPEDSTWWSVADAFAGVGDMRWARVATQHAVPVMSDLLEAMNEDRVWRTFSETTPTSGAETSLSIFRRYISAFISRFPTLNQVTKLDLGDARVTVIDIDRVAPEGLGEARRQTELMYLLGFQIVARNFFLRPEDAQDVPAHVRDWHRERFKGFREASKTVRCDEFQRTKGAHYVQQQFDEIARRGAKLNVGIGLASQRPDDFTEYLLRQSTGRFILGAGDTSEAKVMADTFNLSTAAHEIIRYGLNGPRPDGSGSPFVLQIRVRAQWYELYLLNLMGPVELWALSTTPEDTALRRRVYDAVGSAEGRRRLARVFPRGSAADEIVRRRDARMRTGEDQAMAMGGVISELADELVNGTGLGTIIRDADEPMSGPTTHASILEA